MRCHTPTDLLQIMRPALNTTATSHFTDRKIIKTEQENCCHEEGSGKQCAM